MAPGQTTFEPRMLAEGEGLFGSNGLFECSNIQGAQVAAIKGHQEEWDGWSTDFSRLGLMRVQKLEHPSRSGREGPPRREGLEGADGVPTSGLAYSDLRNYAMTVAQLGRAISSSTANTSGASSKEQLHSCRFFLCPVDQDGTRVSRLLSRFAWCVPCCLPKPTEVGTPNSTPPDGR